MIRRRSPLLAALAGCSALTFAAPILAPDAFGLVRAAHAQQPADFEQILSAYGTFQQHARYGQVWIPAKEVAPEGWHPYPPCNWVHDRKLGWFYDDKTAWGRIVHHYGRWAHDATLGWVWVKGEEFSPAWVVWRTSDKWVGWAPMPPEQDVKEISAAEFNTDKHWTFVEAGKFASRCGDGGTLVSAPPALYPTILTETKLVTEIRFVHGIAIFVLPPPLIINIVDIDIGVFPPWSPCFFGAWFWNWNWMINNIIVVVNNPPAVCGPPAPAMQSPIQIKSSPPPAPPSGRTPPQRPDRPDQRTELPPRLDPPRLTQPPRLVDRLRPFDPPRIVEPQRPSVVVVPPRFDPPQRPNGPRIVKPDGNRPGRGPQIANPQRQGPIVRPPSPQVSGGQTVRPNPRVSIQPISRGSVLR